MKPCSLRLLAAATGITAFPSRIDIWASASTIPAPLAAASTACNRLAACPSRSRMARRISSRAGEALSRILPKRSTMASIRCTIPGNASTPRLRAYSAGYCPSRARMNATTLPTRLSARCRVTTSPTSRNVPSTRSLATTWSTSGYSPPGKSCSMSSSRRIWSASSSLRPISRAEVEKVSSASFPRAARMVQSAATCSRSRSKPIFCSKFAG